MNYEYYKMMENKEYTFLDSITDEEMLSFFKTGKNITLVMDEIEDKYNDKYIEEECIFNWIDKSDFEEYITKRFPQITFHHHIEEFVYVANIGAF